MILVGILIALLVERLLGRIPGWGRPVLFLGVMRGLETILPRVLWHSMLLPLVVVAVPAALAWHELPLMTSPLLQLALSAALLLLCLGPRDLADDVRQMLQARAAGDAPRAEQLARALQRGPDPGESHASLLGALFVQSHERLFGVLLWYFVAGPAGALAYRLASRLPRYLHESAPTSQALVMADWLHGALAWIPARLTALVYGLAGSLDDSVRAWRRLAREPESGWRTQTWAILAEVPTASLGSEEPGGGETVPASLDALLGEVLRMQWRALLIFLAGFALLTTGSLM